MYFAYLTRLLSRPLEPESGLIFPASSQRGVIASPGASPTTAAAIQTALGCLWGNSRAAAGLRTSAAHARWDEIDLGDVAPVIELTRELIAAHLPLDPDRDYDPPVRYRQAGPVEDRGASEPQSR